MLLFCWKSVKFKTNCQNMNLSCKSFLKLTILFSLIHYYFSKNQQNSWLTFEISAFLMLIFNKCMIFLYKYVISMKISKIRNWLLNDKLSSQTILKCASFCTTAVLLHQKSAKLVTNCQNMYFPHSYYFYMNEFFCIVTVLLKNGKTHD